MSEITKWVEQTLGELEAKNAEHISMPIAYAREIMRDKGPIYVLMADIDYSMRSSIDEPVGWTTDKAVAIRHLDEGERRAVIVCDEGKHGRWHWSTRRLPMERVAPHPSRVRPEAPLYRLWRQAR